MRIAISNIAWETADDEALAELLAKHGLDAIDVAPGKYFPHPDRATTAKIDQVRSDWARRGIEITGMQSLLFGTQGLNIFSDDAGRQAMLDHLRLIFAIAAGLGARFLVFGSPKNRDRNGLSDHETQEIAHDFFRAAAEHAHHQGVCLCLEANPERYGCNFITTTDDAAALVRQIDHPAFRLHLDTGTILINGEPGAELVARHADIIAHVHASLPDLVPSERSSIDEEAQWERIAAALQQYRPDLTVSIEMLNPSGSLATIDASLGKICAIFRKKRTS